MKGKISKIISFLMWRGGGIIKFNSILFNAMVFFYLALAYQMYSLDYLKEIFLFVLFSLICVTYGYFINDFGDIELDKAHGKSNTFAKSPKVVAVLIILAVFALSVLSGWRFINRSGFLWLWGIWLFFATFYSIKPFRFKEGGLVGLITPFVTQSTIPIIMVFAVFNRLWQWDTLIFMLYITSRGAVYDIRHEMLDYENDRKTNTQTFAVQKGKKVITAMFVFVRELEKLLLGAVLLMMVIKIPYVMIPVINLSIPPVLPLLIFYVFIYLKTLWLLTANLKTPLLLDPYEAKRKDVFKFIHEDMPTRVIPLYLLLLMSSHYKYNLILLFFFALTYKLFSIKKWKNSWIVKSLFKQKKK